MLGQIFRADPAIGNDKELNKKIVLFDENMMSTLMGGFPNLVWLSVIHLHLNIYILLFIYYFLSFLSSRLSTNACIRVLICPELPAT